MIKKFIKKIKYLYLNFKYRQCSDETCCCGDSTENHYIDPFKYNHSIKSEREWAIESHIKKYSKLKLKKKISNF